MITLEQFKKGKIAINTKTQEEYDNLMRFFDSEGMVFKKFDVIPEKKASNSKIFFLGKEETCFDFCNKKNGLGYANKIDYKNEGYKIILPTDLKEYNEFMGKEECKNCEIINKHIVCKKCIIKNPKPKYLNVGQAINYMLESEDNVIEYYCTRHCKNLKAKARNGEIYTNYSGKFYTSEERINTLLSCWTSIRKYIEPKQKTLNEKIENKETFEYKNNWYRFNKDGAIIDDKGSAIGIELIKELLTKKEKNKNEID